MQGVARFENKIIINLIKTFLTFLYDQSNNLIVLKYL